MSRVIKNPSGYHSRGRTAVEKAVNFGQHAKAHGWTGKQTLDEETGVRHLFARRGESETIDIWWIEDTGAAHPDMLPIYTLAGEKIKCRNVSAVAAIAAKEPDTSRLRKAARKQRRKFDSPTVLSEEEIDDYIVSMQGTLPFDQESTDEEIKVALKGRTISWVNRMSGQVNSALVSDNPKHFSVIRNGRDYVNFVYPVQRAHEYETYGFRAVYLDSIVGVA